MSKLTRQQRHGLWVERMERFEAADCSVAEFCRREAVSVANFYVWKKRLTLPSPSKTNPRNSAPRKPRSLNDANRLAADDKFLPLVVSAAAMPPLLKLPGGASIELPSQLGQKQLTDLIAAVVEATDASRTSEEVAS